jgi:hypothetical protein
MSDQILAALISVLGTLGGVLVAFALLRFHYKNQLNTFRTELYKSHLEAYSVLARKISKMNYFAIIIRTHIEIDLQYQDDPEYGKIRGDRNLKILNYITTQLGYLFVQNGDLAREFNELATKFSLIYQEYHRQWNNKKLEADRFDMVISEFHKQLMKVLVLANDMIHLHKLVSDTKDIVMPSVSPNPIISQLMKVVEPARIVPPAK